MATSTVTPSAAATGWSPSEVFDIPSAFFAASLPPLLPASLDDVADDEGVFGSFPVPPLSSEFAPPGLALPVVGDVLFVSAETVRLFARTGVAAVLSTNASESVTTTPTAKAAPDLLSVASASVVMFVFRLALIVTLPLAAEIVLVPESWLLAVATRTEAARAAFWPSALAQSVVSVSGCPEKAGTS